MWSVQCLNNTDFLRFADFTRKNCDSQIPYKRHFVTKLIQKIKLAYGPSHHFAHFKIVLQTRIRTLNDSECLAFRQPCSADCFFPLPDTPHYTASDPQHASSYGRCACCSLYSPAQYSQLTVSSDNHCRLKVYPLIVLIRCRSTDILEQAPKWTI